MRSFIFIAITKGGVIVKRREKDSQFLIDEIVAKYLAVRGIFVEIDYKAINENKRRKWSRLSNLEY